MRRALRIAILILTAVIAAWPQFLPPLEADSPEEFDDYLTVEAAADPQARLTATATFRKHWPKSAMLPRIHEIEFNAWRAVGDPRQATRAGRAALKAAPANLSVKAALAVLLAGSEPAQAERLARETLDAIDTFRAPRRIAPEDWKRMRASIRSQATMALAIVKFGNGDTKGALAGLEEADRLAPAVDPALCLRLGRLYAALQRKAEARRQFERAIESGDTAAAAIARQELARLN